MARPDPALLDAARYPHRCTIEPRFGDLDVNMHVNNVALASILEEARVRFHRDSGLIAIRGGASTMVASLNIDFVDQTRFPDAIEVLTGISAIGRTSKTLIQLARQGDRVVALARTVLVSVDAQGPSPHSEAFLEQAQPWMALA